LSAVMVAPLLPEESLFLQAIKIAVVASKSNAQVSIVFFMMLV
jgi:hypothetical protein